MKSRRAAALAFVGWYLMAPILHRQYSPDLPHSAWSVVEGNFPSQAACEAERARYLTLEKKTAKPGVVRDQSTATGLLHVEFTNATRSQAIRAFFGSNQIRTLAVRIWQIHFA